MGAAGALCWRPPRSTRSGDLGGTGDRMSQQENGATAAQTAGSTELRLAALEAAVEAISGNLDVIGKSAVDSMNETEMAVAHLLALEAIVVQVLKAGPVDADAVKAAIKEKTAEISGHPEGSPLVIQAAERILGQAAG